LLTAFSEQLSIFQTELTELKQSVATPSSTAISEEFADTLAKIFRENRIAMAEFNEATKRREVITEKTERQALLLARLGVAGFFTILIIMLFFVLKFTNNVESLSEQIFTIENHVKVNATDLGNIKQSLLKLNTALSSADTQSYQEITVSVGELQNSVETVRNKMKELTNNISEMRQQLSELSTQDDAQRYRPYR
jgi:phage shock protein A